MAVFLRHGKKEALADWAGRIGLLRIIERLGRRRCLVALCYHRIGYAEHTPYDPALYSATPEQFDDQIGYLKSNFPVTTLDEALALVEQPSRLQGPRILITFDDGYLDNYACATPILKSHGAQGTFFLPTSFIDSLELPWWDQIAFLLQTCGAPEIVLDYPRPLRFQLSPATLRTTLRSVLSEYKSPETVDTDRFVAGLERACGATLPTAAATRQFMNWSEAADMVRQGMAVGSHTHSHRLLGKLPFDEQVEELATSSRILKERLAIAGDVLAYPVGSRTSFSNLTQKAALQAGYRAAFSFFGGINLPSQMERFNLLRIPVGAEMSFRRFRMATALATALGRQY